MEKREVAQNFIDTILINFDKRYRKRVMRYYYRSVRRFRRELNKRGGNL